MTSAQLYTLFYKEKCLRKQACSFDNLSKDLHEKLKITSMFTMDQYTTKDKMSAVESRI